MITQLSFNTQAAKIHGVEGAVLLSHIVYWVHRNRLNKQNEINGQFWTYNTAETFTKLFPFWNSQKIRRLLSKLETENAIVIGCHNKAKYDRTKWFTITKHTESLYANDFSELNNGSFKSEQSNNQKEKLESLEVNKQYQITTQVTKQVTTKKRKEIIFPFDGDIFHVAWKMWKDYKKVEKGFKFKSPISEQTSLYNLQKISNNNEKEAVEIINNAIAQGWSGLYARKGGHKDSNKKFDNEKYLTYLEKL